MTTSYLGSGPYCYANSFAMLIDAPSTAVIETLTGSPFGMQLLAGKLPLFDPYGWDPAEGFDNVLTSLGWTSKATGGGGADDALDRLREAVARGPVWIGPVEMGHLHHQPEMTGAIGADHYVVVLAVDDERVLMHDPQGFPYATLPVADFMTAWRAESVSYGQSYTMRTDFVRVADVSEVDALKNGLPSAAGWLDMDADLPVPPGTLGNGEAAEGLAELAEAGPDNDLRMHLAHFAIRVGARRLNDAAACLARIGLDAAAEIAATQSRIVGGLQHPVVTRDDAALAAGLRALAPTYDRLRAALSS